MGEGQRFINDRLPLMHEALDFVNMLDELVTEQDPSLEEWAPRAWSELSSNDFKELCADLRLERFRREKIELELEEDGTALLKSRRLAKTLSEFDMEIDEWDEEGNVGKTNTNFSGKFASDPLKGR